MGCSTSLEQPLLSDSLKGIDNVSNPSLQSRLFITSADVNKLKSFNINYCHLCRDKGIFFTTGELYIDDNEYNRQSGQQNLKYLCEFHKERGLLKSII